MSKESSSTSGGIGFAGLLTIAFIVLKLCNVINWSWWWVLSPLWIHIALVAALGIIYVAFKIPSWRKEYKRRKRIKRIKELMAATGLDKMAATIKFDMGKGIKMPKSKWQQRMEEIQEAQRKIKGT